VSDPPSLSRSPPRILILVPAGSYLSLSSSSLLLLLKRYESCLATRNQDGPGA